ncbi:hypothetical protein PROFUN_08302 [Planoprotostelium fungivorum]|uniref:Uncharacterized protein n=1 Tax=Planoprotostelium fungivorum TaxID=1890364 RepID=A0A2P6NK15_9EUKA|nr:hypothetical protein PROFUN_08302 [Planoprotostelium fungivorum]
MRSRFLTVFFMLDAILNLVCGIVLFVHPRWFYWNVHYREMTPELEWVGRTISTYFILAGTTMAYASRCQDVVMRRRLMRAYIVAGLIHFPTTIWRGFAEHWTHTGPVLATAISDLIVIGPYIWFSFIQPEWIMEQQRYARVSQIGQP